MRIVTMILGQSGTGKSTSLRNFDPNDVLLIQSINKPLPFKSKNWRSISKTSGVVTGNIYVSDNYQNIIQAINKTTKQIIVIDDFQYLMANEFMARSSERGFDKFTEMASHVHSLLLACSKGNDDKRIYLLSHSEESDIGKIKIKTIGKMLDEKITLEGMVTIVLRTIVTNGIYEFSTQNSGNDTTKSPIGLFENERVPNDLSAVDKAIVEYYSLNAQTQSSQTV